MVTESDSPVSMSNEALEKLLDQAGESIFVIDWKGRMAWCNKVVLKKLGYTKEQVIGRNFSGIVARGDVAAATENFLACMLGKTMGPFEITVLGNEGITVDAQITIVPQTVNGKISGVLGIAHDIREIKAAESAYAEALIKSQFSESLIQSSAVATFVVDADHKVLYWNKACEELTGTKASDMIGTSNQWKAFYDKPRPCVADLVIDGKTDGIEKLYATYSRSTLNKNGVRAEGWYPNLGGKDRYISFDAAPIYDAGGNITAAIETLQDTTASKRVQEGLEEVSAEAENAYLAVVENTGTAVMVINNDMTVSRVNKKFTELTGYTREEFEGKKKWSALAATAGDRKLIEKYHWMRRIDTNLAPKAYRFSLRDKAGNVKTVLMSTGIVPGTQQIIGSMTDVSDVEKSRDEYSTLLENTGTAVMVIENDMTVSRVNKKFTELTGYTREEFEGKKKWTSLVATKEDLARMKHYHKMRRKGPGMAPKAYRFDLLDKQGAVKSMYLNIDVVPGTRQSIASMLDITERMRARQAVERFHRQQEDDMKKDIEQLGGRIADLENEKAACESALAATLGSRKAALEAKEKIEIGDSLRGLEAKLDTSLKKGIKRIRRGITRMEKTDTKS